MNHTITQAVFETMQVHAMVDPPGLLRVHWQSGTQADRRVQVYVDGRLAAVSATPRQRELWLIVDPMPGRKRRVDLLAVPAEMAWEDHADRLPPSGQGEPALRPPIRVRRDPRLPMGTRLRVRVGDTVLHESPLFHPDQSRGGFGTMHGLGAMGFDDASAPGFGGGDSELGMGPLGFDGSCWRWAMPVLAPGAGPVTLQAVDDAGQPLTPEQAYVGTNTAFDFQILD